MEQDRIDEIDATTSERNRSVATEVRLSGAAVKRPQITDALGRTFFEEWARVGYSALSLDAVARKAGVGKAALYRRWRSKADMARDLLTQIGAAMPASLEAGDRGSLEEDLYATLIAASRMMRDPLVRRIMPDLYAALGREPALAAAMRPGEAMWEKKVKTLIDRAVARGELPADVDRRSAMAFLIGPLYWRLIVLDERGARRQIRQIARMTAAAIAAGTAP
jgi:AcrR family transcriptional regulator